MSVIVPRRALVTAVLMALLALFAGGIWLYRSLSYVPQFYSEALAATAAQLQQSSREMLRRTAALNNDLRRQGKWEALFTDREINGWLAVDVPKNHPELIPPQAHDPRVRIVPGRLLAGARIDAAVSAVVSVELDVRLAERNVLAVRVQKLRVGDVPWGLDQIIDEVIAAARDWGIRVEQTQSDGDPVLLLTMPAEFDERRVFLERLELRDGEIYLAGQTK
jgi:hypothetical protein